MVKISSAVVIGVSFPLVLGSAAALEVSTRRSSATPTRQPGARGSGSGGRRCISGPGGGRRGAAAGARDCRTTGHSPRRRSGAFRPRRRRSLRRPGGRWPRAGPGRSRTRAAGSAPPGQGPPPVQVHRSGLPAGLDGGPLRQIVPGRLGIQGVPPGPRRRPAPRRTSRQSARPERPPLVPAPDAQAVPVDQGLASGKQVVVPPAVVLEGHGLPGVPVPKQAGPHPGRLRRPGARPGDSPTAAASRTEPRASPSGDSSPPEPPAPWGNGPGSGAEAAGRSRR